MASSHKLILSFLVLLFLMSSLQIQARESQFFSKVTPHNNNYAKESKVLHTEVPAPEPAPEPEHHPETHNGYGLYGHGTSQFPPTTTTTNSGAYYNSGDLPTKTPTEENVGGSYEYKEPNNNNGYDEGGMLDTRFVDTGYTTTSNYNNNGFETKKNGMSDTKFLENGRYYYGVGDESYYRNGYESKRGSGEGFGTSRGVNSRNYEYNNGGYYGNNEENSYEFNNSMESYDQNQEEEYQEEYVP